MLILNMLRSAALFTVLSTSVAFRQTARFATARPVAMALKEGETVPNVIFKARVRDEKIGGSNPFTWKDVSSADLFKGKRSVVFALPGGMLRISPTTARMCAYIVALVDSLHSHLLLHTPAWIREALW